MKISSRFKKRKLKTQRGTSNIKKSRCHILSKNIVSTVQFIEKCCKRYNVSVLCRLLEISRSVYYFYKNKPLTTIKLRNNQLKKKIYTIFFNNKQRYGTTKTYHILLKEHVRVSLKYVQKLMRQLGL